MGVEEVVKVKDELAARLATLAVEVTEGAPAAGELSHEQVFGFLAAWGTIPAETLDDIREMQRNIEKLAGLSAISSVQARLACAPVRQVIGALDGMIARVRQRKGQAA